MRTIPSLRPSLAHAKALSEAVTDVMTPSELADWIVKSKAALAVMQAELHAVDVYAANTTHFVNIGSSWYSRTDYGLPFKKSVNMQDAIANFDPNQGVPL